MTSTDLLPAAVDMDGVYDPCLPNDRLLLGMNGMVT